MMLDVSKQHIDDPRNGIPKQVGVFAQPPEVVVEIRQNVVLQIAQSNVIAVVEFASYSVDVQYPVIHRAKRAVVRVRGSLPL